MFQPADVGDRSMRVVSALTRECLGALLLAVGSALTERTELAPLLHDRMEECQPEEQLLPFIWLRLDVLKVSLRHCRPCADQIGSYALWRLEGELARSLQDRHREVLRGHRRKPQPEVVVDGRLGRERFDYLLELWHPRFCEVAILQDDPITLFAR